MQLFRRFTVVPRVVNGHCTRLIVVRMIVQLVQRLAAASYGGDSNSRLFCLSGRQFSAICLNCASDNSGTRAPLRVTAVIISICSRLTPLLTRDRKSVV